MRGSTLVGVVGICSVGALLVGCSHSTTYRDDRAKVSDEIASFGGALKAGGSVSEVPATRIGPCQHSHYAPVQWNATLTGTITQASEHDRSQQVVNSALIMNLGRTYFVTTVTPDHNGSQAAVFATKDRATQLTVTTNASTVRVDGFASC